MGEKSFDCRNRRDCLQIYYVLDMVGNDWVRSHSTAERDEFEIFDLKNKSPMAQNMPTVRLFLRKVFCSDRPNVDSLQLFNDTF